MRCLYAVHLNAGSRGAARRFALYEVMSDGAHVFWGEGHQRIGRKLFPHMVYSQAPNLPAFHFKVTPEKRHCMDGAEDALCELAEALARHWQEPVSIQLLNGWNGFIAKSEPR